MTIYDLMIVGAGPAGIEAALQAAARGLTYLLIDKFDAGSLIEQTMANKKFYQIYGRNVDVLKGVLAFPDRAKGYELVALWKQQVAPLAFHKNESLKTITRSGSEPFVVTTTKGAYQARFVLLTSGTFEHHKTLQVEGEEGNPNVHYALDYYQDYQNQQVVVVGGGNTALETAIYCGDSNKVTLLVRRDRFTDSATEANQMALRELIDKGTLRVVHNAAVTKILPNEVAAQTPQGPLTLPYDLLFVHIGFEKPTDFLASLGLEVRNGEPVYNENFESNIPGLYIAGALTGSDSIVECANQTYQVVHQLLL
ncbi:NAD(P)/FAD-dependent oxidoreductase [Candidatus Berkelbacteria bacterium]|nr:NAD(P)/FAD-dependent oxidoreductase [Candidatus Berkelbacteria bacterium]